VRVWVTNSLRSRSGEVPAQTRPLPEAAGVRRHRPEEGQVQTEPPPGPPARKS